MSPPGKKAGAVQPAGPAAAATNTMAALANAHPEEGSSWMSSPGTLTVGGGGLMVVSLVLVVGSAPLSYGAAAGVVLLPPAGITFLLGVLAQQDPMVTWCCRFIIPLATAIMLKTLSMADHFNSSIDHCLDSPVLRFYCYWCVVRCVSYVAPIVVPTLYLAYQDAAGAPASEKRAGLWFAAGLFCAGVSLVGTLDWILATASGEYVRVPRFCGFGVVTTVQNIEFFIAAVFCLQPSFRRRLEVHLKVSEDRRPWLGTRAAKVANALKVSMGPPVRVVPQPGPPAPARKRRDDGHPDLLEPPQVSADDYALASPYDWDANEPHEGSFEAPMEAVAATRSVEGVWTPSRVVPSWGGGNKPPSSPSPSVSLSGWSSSTFDEAGAAGCRGGE